MDDNSIYILSRQVKIWVWSINNPIKIIVGFGIILRLIIAVLYQHISIYPDSSGYIYLAERILNLNLSGYEGQRTPGYPLLIALSGNGLPIVILLQAIIGVATSVFVYKSLLLINFGKRYALLFSLGVAAYLPIIFFELCILSETLTLFFITLIFYFLFGIIYFKRTGTINFIVLSLLCSYLVFIKPFYIFLPFIIFFVLILQRRKTRHVIYRYAIIIILPSLTLIGWCQINYQNTGYFTPTTFYGFNAAQNCVAFAEKTSDEYKQIGDIYAKYRDANLAINRGTAMSIWEAYNELEATTQLSFVDLSDRLYSYSLATIKQNPLAYLQQVGISWIDFWKTSLYWHYDEFTVPHSNIILKIICYIERALVQLLKIIFVLFIPYNLIHYLKKKRKPNPQFIISFVVLCASVLQAFASYGTNSRFSFPFEILIVASAIMNIYTLIKTKKG